MFLDLDGKGPLAQQIYRGLRAAILTRELRPGARLPSTRALAADLGVSRNVALAAYEQLRAEGYAVGRVGSGTVVSPTLPEPWPLAGTDGERRRAAAPRLRPQLAEAAQRTRELARRIPLHWDLRDHTLPYDFRFGRPSFDDFPRALWCRYLGRRARRATRQDLDYGPPQGRAELRTVLAERLRRTRGIDADPERIVVTSGSQQALDLLTRVLLDPGDRVLLEEPHYLGARWVFSAAGAELVAAEVDDQGMRVPETTPRPAPRLAYTTPSHQFPTGFVMPLSRRLALLEWAARTGAFVLEDDYDSEYRYGGRPLQALAGLDGEGRVIYIGTLSKLMFPALRIGYIVVPDCLYDAIVAAKALADTGCSALTQLALADFIREGHFDRHLQRTRARNAARRATLLAAIETHFGDRAEVSGAAGGLHVLVWLRSRNGMPIRSIGRKAEAAGVGLYSVAPYYLHPPAGRSGMLLGYGSLDEEEIRSGIARLAQALP